MRCRACEVPRLGFHFAPGSAVGLCDMAFRGGTLRSGIGTSFVAQFLRWDLAGLVIWDWHCALRSGFPRRDFAIWDWDFIFAQSLRWDIAGLCDLGLACHFRTVSAVRSCVPELT